MINMVDVPEKEIMDLLYGRGCNQDRILTFFKELARDNSPGPDFSNDLKELEKNTVALVEKLEENVDTTFKQLDKEHDTKSNNLTSRVDTLRKNVEKLEKDVKALKKSMEK